MSMAFEESGRRAGRVWTNSWVSWAAAAALALGGFIGAGLSLERSQQYWALAAFAMGAIALAVVAWQDYRQIMAVLAAFAGDHALEIARTLDASVCELEKHAKREVAVTESVHLKSLLECWEDRFLTLFRTQPVLPKLTGRLFVSAGATFLSTLLLLSLLTMSLALANCRDGICEAVYSHSCITATGPGIGPIASTATHFLYFGTAALFNLTEEVHRPATRAAQAMSAFTSLTWVCFLAGSLGGRFLVLLLVQESLRPAALARQAILHLRGEPTEGESDADARQSAAPSGRL